LKLAGEAIDEFKRLYKEHGNWPDLTRMTTNNILEKIMGKKMPLNSFDKKSLNEIQQEINATLFFIANKYGISLNVSKVRCDNGLDTQILVSGKIIANREEVEKAEFASICHMYSLIPEDYGREFFSNGTGYKIFAIKPRNRKYPILAKNVRGTTYKFGPLTVKRALQESA